MGSTTEKEEVEDEVCEICGGAGVIATAEQVWPGEPHMADIGESPCPACQSKDEDEN